MASSCTAATQSAIASALSPRASLFARLGLPNAPCEPGKLRRAYHAAALVVHPDKCSHPKAKVAFQKISEAFDKLSQPGGQKNALNAASQSRRGTGHQSRNSADEAWMPEESYVVEEEVDEHGSRGGRRWWDAGWSEFEQRLRQKEAEAEQLEAMEAAERRGDDMLDAYMAFVNEEATRNREPRTGSSCTKDHGDNESARGKKRQHEDGSATRPCAGHAFPFHSTCASQTRSRTNPSSSTPGGMKVTLANGAEISIAHGSTTGSAANMEPANISALDHLDSDESELSD